MAYDESSLRGRESGALEGAGLGAYRSDRLASSDYQEYDYRGSRHREADPVLDHPEPTYATLANAPAGAGRRRGSTEGGRGDRHAPYRRPEEQPRDLDDRGTTALTDVFDDPEHGEPGRDRMAVHVAWELLLLIGIGVLAFQLYRGDPAALRAPALDPMLLWGAVLGLLAMAAGLSLRAGAPNLALGPVAVASALHYAENGDLGTGFAVANAAAVAAVGGLLIALLVVGLHVPAWAASLGGALATIAFIQMRTGPVEVQGNLNPTPQAFYLFGGFAVVALLGGLLGAVRPVRRAVGRFRPVRDPADRRGAAAAMMTGTAIVVSMLLAVAAGTLLAASSNGPVRLTTGLEWTGLAIGTALFAGTSAFGRRGGVFGTLFAVVLVTLFQQYEQQQNWHISIFAVAGALVGGGLVVTRLIEAYGRPLGAVIVGPAADDTGGQPAATAWSGGQQEPWGSLPAQPSAARGNHWR